MWSNQCSCVNTDMYPCFKKTNICRFINPQGNKKMCASNFSQNVMKSPQCSENWSAWDPEYFCKTPGHVCNNCCDVSVWWTECTAVIVILHLNVTFLAACLFICCNNGNTEQNRSGNSLCSCLPLQQIDTHSTIDPNRVLICSYSKTLCQTI